MNNCGPCMFRDKSTRALKFCITCQESQCKTCAEVHSSSKATRNHLLIHIEEVKTDSVIKRDLEKFQKCGFHQDKHAEFYCLDHSHLMCTSCLLSSEKQECNTAVDIEAAGQQLIESKFIEQTRADLENVISHCKKEEQKIQILKTACTKESKEIQKYMRDIRHKIITKFEKCENDILDKVNKNVQLQLKEFSNKQKSFSQTRKTAEENKEILQTITNIGSKADLFRYVLSITEQFTELQSNKTNDTFKTYSNLVQLSSALVAFSVDTNPIMKYKTVMNTNASQNPTKLQTSKHCLHEVTKRITFTNDTDILR